MMDAMSPVTSPAGSIDPGLLKILACPACRAGLSVDGAAAALVCRGCGRAYPVRDGIPVLLTDEARLPAGSAGSAGTD
jgi:uncharacterized protein